MAEILAIFGLRLIGRALLALTMLATPSVLSARCVGADIPIVAQAELETGRDPANAVGWINNAIAITGPAERRTIASLYLVQSIAYSMSGQDSSPAIEAATKIAASFTTDDPIRLFLKLTPISRIKDELKRTRIVDEVASVQSRLPDGSEIKTCLGVDIAYWKSYDEAFHEAFEFASHAYRNLHDKRNTRARAEAASILAYIVAEGHQFDYSEQLQSEALSFFTAKELYDLAANEYVVRGGSRLEMGDWQRALLDYELSKKQALNYGNDYAVAYAQLGICKASLEGDLIEQAEPACNEAYATLNKPWERMALVANDAKASLLLSQNRPEAAVLVLSNALAKFSSDAASGERSDAYRTRAAAFSALGRDEEAYSDLVAATRIAEKLYKREQNNATIIAQARFQTEELQNDLALEQEASEASKRIALLILICTVTVLLLLGLFVLTLLDHRRKFRKLAMIDPLTNLSNRRATLNKAKAALRDAGANTPPATIALLDIDHFKRCNDTYGHDAGDEVLREFARIINEEMRTEDIVGRWGGEEFLVIFPRTHADEAAAAIQRIRSAAGRETFAFAPDYALQFSAGIAELDETERDLREFIKLADRRLYAAKAEGRNRTSAEGCGIDVLASLRRSEPDRRSLS